MWDAGNEFVLITLELCFQVIKPFFRKRVQHNEKVCSCFGRWVLRAVWKRPLSASAQGLSCSHVDVHIVAFPSPYHPNLKFRLYHWNPSPFFQCITMSSGSLVHASRTYHCLHAVTGKMAVETCKKIFALVIQLFHHSYNALEWCLEAYLFVKVTSEIILLHILISVNAWCMLLDLIGRHYDELRTRAPRSGCISGQWEFRW